MAAVSQLPTPLYVVVNALLVFPIRAIVYLAPFALVALWLETVFGSRWGLSLIADAPPTVKVLLLLWSFAETLWILHYAGLRSRLSRHRASPPSYSSSVESSLARDARRSRMELFHRCHEDVTDVKSFISNWFFGAPFSSIGTDDLKTWLAWAFFSAPLEEVVHPEDVRQLEEMTQLLVQDTSTVLHPGSTGATCMRHTIDPVQATERPIVYYLVTMAMNLLADGVLTANGFTYSRSANNKFSFWTWTPVEHEQELDTIFFCHGIGVGLSVYLPFLISLKNRFPNRRVVLMELKHISMALYDEIPSQNEFLEAIDVLYNELEITTGTWIGHSLGSEILSWLCRERSSKISRAIFIDPVVFKLHEYNVAYNFLYRRPKTSLELMQKYFCADEIYISHSLRRHFWWYKSVLFPEFLPRPRDGTASAQYDAVVFLSEKDQVIDCGDVDSYLKKNNIRTVVWPGISHGAFINQLNVWADIFAAI